MSTRYIFWHQNLGAQHLRNALVWTLLTNLKKCGISCMYIRSEKEENRGCFEAIQPPAQWLKWPNFVQKLNVRKFWCLQFYKKKNENICLISGIVSKKWLSKKIKQFIILNSTIKWLCFFWFDNFLVLVFV